MCLAQSGRADPNGLASNKRTTPVSPWRRAGWEFYSTVPNSLLEIGGCARDTYWDGRACLGVTHSSQASAEHFQQCAEFLLLRNRGPGPLAMTVLPIAFARRA